MEEARLQEQTKLCRIVRSNPAVSVLICDNDPDFLWNHGKCPLNGTAVPQQTIRSEGRNIQHQVGDLWTGVVG